MGTASGGTGSQGKTGSNKKKLTERRKGVFMNTREKGEADRMKKELREIVERIEDMRHEIQGRKRNKKGSIQLHGKKNQNLKEEWAKQKKEKAEVRIRELTEKSRELEVKFAVRERLGRG